MLSKQIVGLGWGALILGAAAFAADLPIRDVTLYKHGVAYIQRSGTVNAGETARLDFKPGDMNDILKSLTITDRAGGKVAGVRYDANEPLENRLADFPFDLKDGASLAGFLDQAKGARLELKLGAETVAGTILSARLVTEKAKDEKEAEREILVLLLDSGDIRTFDLATAGTVRFPDPKLQGQLREYLAVLNRSNSKDRRGVYIDATGTGARELTVSYMTPSPVWKSSYRLMFSAQGDPTLEGWAIVDNTSGEDWTNVRLAVVSGKPVSFITQLYEPRYIQRPFAELAENRAANPLVYQGAFDKKEEAAKAVAAAPRQFDSGRPVAPQVAPGSGGGIGVGAYRASSSSVDVNVAGSEAGELFEYSFATPVTVKQGESAMLPFLQQKIGARRLLVYAESYGLNPRDAAELNNNTGKTLDGGPITVYDAGSYAGEALVETVPRGDKRLISYGVDLGTRVTTAFDSSQAVVRELHLKGGVLTTRSAIAETKTYTIKNVDAKAKTLVIEHGRRRGYELLEQKPTETTANAYRFEIKLAALGSENLPVREERVLEQTTSVSTMTPDVLASWVQNRALTDAGRAALQRIAEKKRETEANDAALKQADADITSATQDQARIRSNMDSLNRVSGQQDQVQQYARQLAATEAKLAMLRDSQSALRKKEAALSADLNSLLDKLEF